MTDEKQPEETAESPELVYLDSPEESQMMADMRDQTEDLNARFEAMQARKVVVADAKSQLMADKGVPSEKRPM